MYEIVAIGVSAGGARALHTVVPALPRDFAMPVIVVQHLTDGTSEEFAQRLDRASAISVKEADEKEAIRGGCVYVAPAGYHLLIEADRTFCLSAEPPVNYARPSIDVLFQSVAEVFEQHAIGVVLTGANSDGASGLAAIKRAGGLAIVQDPDSADSPAMPRAAIMATHADHILPLDQVATILQAIDAGSPLASRRSEPKGNQNDPR